MKVYQAINAVQSELAKVGIAKDRDNTTQGYKFRGIDDVYNVLAPLLSSKGLCILPRMLTRECVERQSSKGGALFYVTVDAEFDFVCAEDGSKHTVKTFGEAMDSADKATNKAMSAAYKYAAFQAFAIPTEGDNDADAQTHEVKPFVTGRPLDGVWEALSPEEQQWLTEEAEKIGVILRDQAPATALAHIDSLNLANDEKAALWTRLDSKQRAALKKAHVKPTEKAA